MMTEAIDEDGDGDDAGGLDPKLSKCLVHFPRNWKSEKLKEFLSEKASVFLSDFHFSGFEFQSLGLWFFGSALQGVEFKSAKKKKGMALGFVSFENAEQLQNVVKVSPHLHKHIILNFIVFKLTCSLSLENLYVAGPGRNIDWQQSYEGCGRHSQIIWKENEIDNGPSNPRCWITRYGLI